MSNIEDETIIEETQNENTTKNLNEIIYFNNIEKINEFIKEDSKILFLGMPNSSSSHFQEEVLRNSFEEFSTKVSIGFIDVFEEKEFAIKLGIRKFPTTLFYKDGVIILSEEGVSKNIENSIMQII